MGSVQFDCSFEMHRLTPMACICFFLPFIESLRQEPNNRKNISLIAVHNNYKFVEMEQLKGCRLNSVIGSTTLAHFVGVQDNLSAGAMDIFASKRNRREIVYR